MVISTLQPTQRASVRDRVFAVHVLRRSMTLDMASVCMSLLPATLISWVGALWTFVSAPPLGGTGARTRGRQLVLMATRLMGAWHFGVAGKEVCMYERTHSKTPCSGPWLKVSRTQFITKDCLAVCWILIA